ncbi:hypothetical protein DF16_orf01165 [Bacillus thuringiensis serovar kurstaki str. YBT-1520]|nr:hypothetical protein BMB171_C4393 [Bacillus thuringiensis BMB171]AIM29580.1 hypothetical protein DF16_orf01165 [Bacillus thuringiensis serovar kurstaki str. YBT-1520]CCW07366.1 hypothetical protein EBGED10_40960 [Bacillus sp. GeD10]
MSVMGLLGTFTSSFISSIKCTNNDLFVCFYYIIDMHFSK